MRKYTPFNIYNILTSAALWAIIILVFTQCACGAAAQLPKEERTPPSAGSVPLSPAVIKEPTEAAPVYVTTAPLNVRACASVDCEKLADLPINTQVTIFILDLQGPGCEGGEWYAIDAPKSGYVCSLYIEER